jgi:hypothetical protein
MTAQVNFMQRQQQLCLQGGCLRCCLFNAPVHDSIVMA